MNQSLPLAGRLIGISVSPPDDHRSGFDAADVTDATRRLSIRLLDLGARLAFGHNWRPGGILHEVYRLAEDRQSVSNPDAEPTIVTFLSAVDQVAPLDGDIAKVEHILRIHQCKEPTEGHAVPPAYRAARAYTHMRIEMTRQLDARICLGGKSRSSAGRLPGVLEEIFLAMLARKPLYLTRLLGGVTEWAIEALTNETAPALGFSLSAAIQETYQQRATDDAHDPHFLLPGVTAFLQERTTQALQNGLDERQNAALFDATSLDEVVDQVVAGLRNRRD